VSSDAQALLRADVEAARTGSEAARRRLFTRHQRGVTAYCLVASGRDRERALDWVQETFLRAFQGLDELDDPERFQGWLFTIARNVCSSGLSRDGRRERILRALEIECEIPTTAVERLEREQRIAMVRQVIADVEDPTLRRIVELRYGDPEHSTRSIAERLAIPQGTVTVKLLRFRAAAKRALCRMLAEEETA
jgi:RNA polymerase sigma-70 factor (ECF subfamily)